MPDAGLVVNSPTPEAQPDAPLTEGAVYVETLPEERSSPEPAASGEQAGLLPDLPHDPRIQAMAQQLEQYKQQQVMGELASQAQDQVSRQIHRPPR